MKLTFDRDFKPAYGRAVPVSSDVLRITANNSSPFSFFGTNSYIVGKSTLAVIDPGPENDAHLDALLTAIGGRPVSHIFVTHTHTDHSPLARRLSAATGARMVGGGPHREADGTRPLESLHGDLEFLPDITLGDGGTVDGDGWTIAAILTPGHAFNHAAFELLGTGVLFSGDHVMGWSTTVVAPPEGSMADYMTSLDKLSARDHQLYLPGHGGGIENPVPFVRALKTHRVQREQSIVNLLGSDVHTVDDLLDILYRTTPSSLRAAAGSTVLAHLQHLLARGLVRASGAGGRDDVFHIA